MEAQSDWYNRAVKELNLHRDTLSKKDAKKYKLDLLLRIVKRVDDFSSYCGECQSFKGEITGLIVELGTLVQLTDNKAGRRSHNKATATIVKHLQKTHKLVSEGYYKGIWMAIGTGIGVAIGAALGNASIGTPLGIGIGLAVGSYLDKKAKQEGKVI
ncbi:glycine zipper family protein [Chloroflexota bacterium]